MNDLELMYLLKENGYEATAENLAILKEELKNEATLEKEPTVLKSNIKNNTVYADEETSEDVKGVVFEGFSDIELMEYLNESGYEPSIENLIILREGLESGEIVLDENKLTRAGAQIGGAALKGAHNAYTGARILGRKIIGGVKKIASKVGDVAHFGNTDALNARAEARKEINKETGGDVAKAEKDHNEFNKKVNTKVSDFVARDKASDDAKKLAKRMNKGHVEPTELTITRNGSAGVKNRVQSTATAKIGVEGDKAVAYKGEVDETKGKNRAITESYSDYELYQLLEANGYTTTSKNLQIFKEGLYTGKYIID